MIRRNFEVAVNVSVKTLPEPLQTFVGHENDSLLLRAGTTGVDWRENQARDKAVLKVSGGLISVCCWAKVGTARAGLDTCLYRRSGRKEGQQRRLVAKRQFPSGRLPVLAVVSSLGRRLILRTASCA